MLKIDLQLFGGNGTSGSSLSGGGGGNINIIEETDVWSYRHNPNNEPFVDAINDGIIDVMREFPDIMETVNDVSASKLGGADALNTLGYYGAGKLGININYTDITRMNATYDASVKSGFHPSRGNKSGTEAVTIHEMGHAVTDHVAKKMGVASMDEAAKRVVKDAYKATKSKGGNKSFAKKISGYAAKNYSECVAEAVADYFCNGSKAHANSKAIISELKKYI